MTHVIILEYDSETGETISHNADPSTCEIISKNGIKSSYKNVLPNVLPTLNMQGQTLTKQLASRHKMTTTSIKRIAAKGHQNPEVFYKIVEELLDYYRRTDFERLYVASWVIKMAQEFNTFDMTRIVEEYGSNPLKIDDLLERVVDKRQQQFDEEYPNDDEDTDPYV